MSSVSDESKTKTNKDKSESSKINVSNQEVSGNRSSNSSINPISNYYNDFFENFRQSMQNIQNFYKRKISKWSFGVCVFLHVLFRCNVQRCSVTNNGNGERGAVKLF